MFGCLSAGLVCSYLCVLVRVCLEVLAGCAGCLVSGCLCGGVCVCVWTGLVRTIGGCVCLRFGGRVYVVC